MIIRVTQSLEKKFEMNMFIIKSSWSISWLEVIIAEDDRKNLKYLIG